MAKWIKEKERIFIDLENAREQYTILGYPHRKMLNMMCEKCRMITVMDSGYIYEYCPHCGSKMER